MPFDKSLDKELFKIEKEFGMSKLIVSVMSYNDGMPKVQISRQNQNEEGAWIFSKLGRLTKEEAVAMSDMIREACQNL